MPSQAERGRSVWESLPAIIALLGTMAAIAYFLGKQYWDSYYSAFGIPPSAVRLSPPEYMFASKRFFTFLVFVLGPMAIYWFMPQPGQSTAPARAGGVEVPKALVTAGRVITYPFPDWELPERWEWTYTAAWQVHFLGAWFLFYAFYSASVISFWIFLPLSTGYFVVLFVAQFGNRACFVFLAAVLLFFGIVAFMTTAPGSLAERDAQKVMDNPERLPQVEVLWDKNVEGSAAIDVAGGAEARILTTNSDTYFFLVEDQDAEVIVAVPSIAIRAVRYVPKSD